MAFYKFSTGASFLDGSKLYAVELNSLQNQFLNAVDGYNGGIYPLSAPITFSGSYLKSALRSDSILANNGTDYSLSNSGGALTLTNTGALATSSSTLSMTAATTLLFTSTADGYFKLNANELILKPDSDIRFEANVVTTPGYKVVENVLLNNTDANATIYPTLYSSIKFTNTSTTRTMTLDNATVLNGTWIELINYSGNALIIRNPALSTILTLANLEKCVLMYVGGAWTDWYRHDLNAL